MAAGYMSIPPSTIGPIGWSRKWNAVTTPKLPPPPRSPQNSSGLVVSEATTWRPSAVTTSASMRLSQVKPSLRSSQPLPLPRARPPTPVSDTLPSGDRQAVLLGGGVDLPPGSAALDPRRSSLGVDLMAFMSRRSRQIPASHTAEPVTPWPPP